MVPDEIAVLERLSQSATEALIKLRVRSALNPGLLLSGVISVPSLILAYFSSGGFQIALTILAFIPVLTTCGALLYFMVRDADKLQSEEYQIQKRALDIIEQKGGPLTLSPASLDSIANPSLKRLPSGADEGRK